MTAVRSRAQLKVKVSVAMPTKSRVYLANNLFQKIKYISVQLNPKWWYTYCNFSDVPACHSELYWQTSSHDHCDRIRAVSNHSPPGVDCVLRKRLPPVWTSSVQEPAVPTVTWSLVRFMTTVVTWPVNTTRGGTLKARLRWRLTSIWPDKHYINHC